MRLTMCLVLVAASAAAQGTTTKATPEEYPVHGAAGPVGLGAEYMVRSVGSPKGSFIADKFLVVEIALFPPRDGMTITTSAFVLRLNGKDKLLAQTPSMVAASIKYPDWDRPRGLTVGAGPVIFGRPTPVERFPGDRRPMEGRGRVDSEEAPDYGQIVTAVSLPEGPRKQPVSGYLFFPFGKKPEKLKKVELLVQFETSGEPAVLRLR